MSNGPTRSNALPPMDWDRAPWNRWSFLNMREVLPTVEVWRGTGPVRQFERVEKPLGTLPVKSLAGKEASLTDFLNETFTDGLLVLHRGKIVFEAYMNDMQPRTLHLSQSVAKSVTGMTAGILVGRGLLDPGKLVSDYIPELAGTGWKGATLQQVLDMSTGVKFDETYTDPNSDMGQLDVSTGWKPIPPDADKNAKWPTHVWEQILGLKGTTRPHGAAFEYRSIETDLLAFCMEAVTGKRLAQIVSEELWQKLGVEESACFTVDSAGYALADGGFNATLRDYGRFGQMVLSGGQGIVPASWIEATRNAPHELFGEPYTIALPQGGYHNQFWVEDPVSRNLMCRGVFGQLIYVDFAHDMVAVKLSTWPDFLNVKMTMATLAALKTVAQAL
ncbi:serine hydrolase domain-containing protein [Aestuariivirga litoralis]|uniref:serine hydrolase domain-containing protein n=1 Tax=Aestuariivirga litoralis TaxID=2650924 RepID=UPI0018C5DC8A|nr:serine hydrolase [Aestuariivirga litoralis]MBG1232383.1 serine hydrolase [Aestuariivirga litoralis]